MDRNWSVWTPTFLSLILVFNKSVIPSGASLKGATVVSTFCETIKECDVEFRKFRAILNLNHGLRTVFRNLE